MKKTYLLLVGIVAFLLSLNVGAAEMPFTDVSKLSWYYDDVQSAYESGLINGVTETEFAPDENLTYAAAIKLASCIHQLYTEGEVTLTAGTPWYQPYLDYAAENGITAEIAEYYAYRSENRIERNTFISLFANALPEEALAPINRIDDGAIRDVPMSVNYSEAIYKMYRAGITQGSEKEHWFQPGAYITRAEVAAIITRMLNPETRVSFTMERTMSEECRQAYVDFLKNTENIGEVFDLIYLDTDDEPELVLTNDNFELDNIVYIYGYTSEGVKCIGKGGKSGATYYVPKSGYHYSYSYEGVLLQDSESHYYLYAYGDGAWGHSEDGILIYGLEHDLYYIDDTRVDSYRVVQWNQETRDIPSEEYRMLKYEFDKYISDYFVYISCNGMYDRNEETIEAVFQ